MEGIRYKTAIGIKEIHIKKEIKYVHTKKSHKEIQISYKKFNSHKGNSNIINFRPHMGNSIKNTGIQTS